MGLLFYDKDNNLQVLPTEVILLTMIIIGILIYIIKFIISIIIIKGD